MTETRQRILELFETLASAERRERVEKLAERLEGELVLHASRRNRSRNSMKASPKPSVARRFPLKKHSTVSPSASVSRTHEDHPLAARRRPSHRIPVEASRGASGIRRENSGGAII
jgi:hypothetical protein